MILSKKHTLKIHTKNGWLKWLDKMVIQNWLTHQKEFYLGKDLQLSHTVKQGNSGHCTIETIFRTFDLHNIYKKNWKIRIFMNLQNRFDSNPAMDIHIHGYPWIYPISWIMDISMDIHGYFG
jgi:hypothetical protein